MFGDRALVEDGCLSVRLRVWIDEAALPRAARARLNDILHIDKKVDLRFSWGYKKFSICRSLAYLFDLLVQSKE